MTFDLHLHNQGLRDASEEDIKDAEAAGIECGVGSVLLGVCENAEIFRRKYGNIHNTGEGLGRNVGQNTAQ